jgi:hypothetical protein
MTVECGMGKCTSDSIETFFVTVFIASQSPTNVPVELEIVQGIPDCESGTITPFLEDH